MESLQAILVKTAVFKLVKVIVVTLKDKGHWGNASKTIHLLIVDAMKRTKEEAMIAV